MFVNILEQQNKIQLANLLPKIDSDEKEDISLEVLVDKCPRIINFKENTEIVLHRNSTKVQVMFDKTKKAQRNCEKP